jgi:proteasome accessory factor C
MAKKSTPIEKAARMLDLVPYISSHQGVSTDELATEFGISVEELLNDLNSLWMCGDNRFDLIDLEFESGFVSIRNAETLNRIRSLSQQEIIAVLIGLDLIEKDLPTNRADLTSDIDSLRKRLGDGLSRIIDASPSLDGKVSAVIKDALKRGAAIEISYYSPTEDAISLRTINPIQVTSENGREFLIAFCNSAQAQRTFRVDRIQKARLVASESPNFSQNNYSISDHVKTVAKLAILKNLRQSRESLGNSITGEGAQVSVSTYGSQWISRTVISSAGAISLTSPAEFRSEIASRARKTLELYR